jgi:hypothetical protein
MMGVVVMISMLLVGCTPQRGVTLDDARNRFEGSSAAYQKCMSTVDGDHICEPQRLIMEADQKAYSEAMSSGLR